MADDEFEERFRLVDGFVFGGVRHGLGQDFVHLVEVAQQDRLGAFEFVGFDVVFERLIVLQHLPGDRLGPDVLAAQIRVAQLEGVEGGVDEILAGHRPLDFLKPGDARVILDALVLEAGHQLGFEQIDLFAQHHIRVFQDRLDQGDQVGRVVVGGRIKLRDRVQQPQAQRVVDRKILGQRHIHDNFVRSAAGGDRQDVQDLGTDQAAEELPGPLG